MLLKQPTTSPSRKKLRRLKLDFPALAAAPAVPQYIPNPMSLLPLPRCFRSNCRAVKKDERSPCALCGSLATSSAPLVTYTIYIEEF